MNAPCPTELSHWSAEDCDIVYLPTVTREPADSGWDGARGRIQALLSSGELERRAGLDLVPERWHVFLCGHPGLIDETERLLVPRGFRQWTPDGGGSLHFERWWQARSAWRTLQPPGRQGVSSWLSSSGATAARRARDGASFCAIHART